jgi:hypothetical protein
MACLDWLNVQAAWADEVRFQVNRWWPEVVPASSIVGWQFRHV